MKAFLAIMRRDLSAGWRGGVWLPIGFFLLVAILYPFGVGPDGKLLERTGGGVLWIAALLAALLPVDRLVRPDAELGVLDQYAVRGIGDEMVALAKLVAHWLGFGPPLMLAALAGGALLRLDGTTLWQLEIGLLLGTPALAALGLLVAALTASLPRSGSLAGLLMLPLAVPVLIFGAGSLNADNPSALKLLAASALFLVALVPFAVAAALRAHRQR